MPKYQISLKSAEWDPSCSMPTIGRTDLTKLVVAFRNFAKAEFSRSKSSKRGVITIFDVYAWGQPNDSLKQAAQIKPKKAVYCTIFRQYTTIYQ